MVRCDPPSLDRLPDAPERDGREWLELRSRNRRLRAGDLMFVVAWLALHCAAVSWVARSKIGPVSKELLLAATLMVPICFGVAWGLSGLPLAVWRKRFELGVGLAFVGVGLVVLACVVILTLGAPAAGILTVGASVALLVYLISWS